MLEFSREPDTADSFSLLRNFEQALGKTSHLNHSLFSCQLFQELFAHLLMHCKDHQQDLQGQSHATVVDALLRVMHEFLLYKAQESQQTQDGKTTQITSVQAYYMPGTDITRVVRKSQESKLPAVKDGNTRLNELKEKLGAPNLLNQPEVNDIIVKIEMKKFQNLIANKIKHKNNLLQADMMRVYPLTKKGHGCMTLYDKDMIDCEEGTVMAQLAAA